MMTTDSLINGQGTERLMYKLKWHLLGVLGVLLLLIMVFRLPNTASVGGSQSIGADLPEVARDDWVIQTPGFKIAFMDAQGNLLDAGPSTDENPALSIAPSSELKADYKVDHKVDYGEILKPLAQQLEQKERASLLVFPQLALDPLMAHEDWLMSLPSEAYTLQLLAGRNEQAIRGFLEKHQALGDLAYFRAQRGDQDWFVVVQGSYDTAQQAESSIMHLPEQIRNSGPWVRSVGSIQSVIR